MVEDTDPSIALVEIVMQGYAVEGRCRGLNERLRLIDLLNNPEITHLQMADVKVRRFPTLEEIVASDGPMFIEKESVVLGRSLASPEAEARRDEAHRFDHVQKQKQLMLVFAPPFRILGNIYVIKDADLSVALPKLFGSFLGMTEAAIVREGGNGLGWDSTFTVVNGQRIEMVCAVPPGYRQVDLAGAGPTREAEESDAQQVSSAVE